MVGAPRKLEREERFRARCCLVWFSQRLVWLGESACAPSGWLRMDAGPLDPEREERFRARCCLVWFSQRLVWLGESACAPSGWLRMDAGPLDPWTSASLRMDAEATARGQGPGASVIPWMVSGDADGTRTSVAALTPTSPANKAAKTICIKMLELRVERVLLKE